MCVCVCVYTYLSASWHVFESDLRILFNLLMTLRLLFHLLMEIWIILSPERTWKKITWGLFNKDRHIITS